VQVAFMYWGTGVFKLLSPAWAGGEMLAYSLMGDWASRAAFWLLQWNLPWGVFDVIVLTTILMELYAPFLLFHPSWQKWFFAWGVVFHTGIGVCLNIWPFMVMPLSYVLFIEPARVKRMAEWVGARLRAWQQRSDTAGARRAPA
jgi:hypothetical protein